MPLVHLVYVSSAVIPFSQDALLALLERSRANNAVAGVTGLLLYRDGNFMQVLEGEDEAVNETHARISRDGRHTGLLTLLKEPISARTFEEWSMGFRNLDSPEVRKAAGYSEIMNLDWRDRELWDNPDRAMRLLQVFHRGMR